jgi:membrane protease YdiL (CAAX protease family)
MGESGGARLPQDLSPGPWLGLAVVVCLPVTVLGFRKIAGWLRSGRALPLPDDAAPLAAGLPDPFGLILFAAMFLSGMLTLIVYDALARHGLVPWERAEAPGIFSAGVFAAQILPAALGLAAAATFGRPALASIGVRLGNLGRGLYVGAGSALFVLPLCVGAVVLSSAVLLLLNVSVHRHPLLERLSASPTADVLALVLVQASVLAPLAEEFMYRGVLQTGLSNHLGPTGALLATSAVFAVAHVAAEPQAILSLFLLGLALGYAAYRTRSLVAPIVAHSLFNTLMVLTGLGGK